MPKRIQRKRTKGWRMPPNTVYVGRRAKWGNWQSRPGDSPEIAVMRYRSWALDEGQPLFDAVRRELGGKDLCCWCALDQPCHADVLLEIANEGTGKQMQDYKMTPLEFGLEVEHYGCLVSAVDEAWNGDVVIQEIGQKGRLVDQYKAVCELARKLAEALASIKEQQPKVLAMLRREGFILDNLDDRWQKLAFTLYSEIVDSHMIARAVLDDEARAAGLSEE